MSNPIVTCHLPESMIRDVHNEALEWDEDGMVPLREERQGTGIVVIQGEEIGFFAWYGYDIWHCQRQCEDAYSIADELEKIGISAHVID